MSDVAVVACPDVGPLDSLAVMLRAAGLEPHLPDARTVGELRAAGSDCAGRPEDLVWGMGYSPPLPLPTLDHSEFVRPGAVRVLVDLKAQRSYPGIVRAFPHLAGRVLWYRINGGRPEHVVNSRGDMGDECRPPCPVVTPNRWYADEYETCDVCDGGSDEFYNTPGAERDAPCDNCGGNGNTRTPWHPTPRYVFWPPLVGAYGTGLALPPREEPQGGWAPPVCLVHNLRGWGYGDLAGPVRALGVRLHGAGSPDGLLNHREVPAALRSCLAYVHLKSNDAPGYALLEALAAGCPVVAPRRLVWRSRMQDLLVPGETYLPFDRETHDALTPADVARITEEVRGHLDVLKDPAVNRKIGEAGRSRLRALLWSPDRPADVASFRKFVDTHYPAART